jgi:hypothetical protein
MHCQTLLLKRIRALPLAFAVCLSASAAHTQEPLPDSIRTIVYSAPDSSSRLRLSPQPQLTFAESNQCLLNSVGGIVVRARGDFVIANTRNRELCFFDSTGRFVRRVGRRGSGPGEYQEISEVRAFRGDSLVVADAFARRLTILSPDGGVVRTASIATPADTLGSVNWMLVLRDGSTLVGFSEFKSGPPRPESLYIWQRAYRYGLDGRLIGPAGRFPQSEHFVQAVPLEHGGVAYWNRAFGRRFSAAPLGDGMVAGDGSGPMVEEYGADGRLRARHRIAIPLRPVTASEIDAYRTAARDASSAADRVLTERRISEMPFPTTLPVYRTVLADPTGAIWLEQYPSPGAAAATWIVVDPSTRRSSLVTVPARFRLLVVTVLSACGVSRDDVDVETIQCHTITGR